MTRADLGKNPHDVRRMFDAVARRYDVTNDVLSLGQDRRWRKDVIDAVDPRQGQAVARWRATMPPERLRTSQSNQPAPAIQSASPCWSGQARIDSAR